VLPKIIVRLRETGQWASPKRNPWDRSLEQSLQPHTESHISFNSAKKPTIASPDLTAIC
jgi:hypothetical protein